MNCKLCDVKMIEYQKIIAWQCKDCHYSYYDEFMNFPKLEKIIVGGLSLTYNHNTSKLSIFNMGKEIQLDTLSKFTIQDAKKWRDKLKLMVVFQ